MESSTVSTWRAVKTIFAASAVVALFQVLSSNALNTAGTWEARYAMVTLIAAVGWKGGKGYKKKKFKTK